MQVTDILKNFNIHDAAVSIREMSGGRVNETYLVDMADGARIVLQLINTEVPINAGQAMRNTGAVMEYLKTQSSPLQFPAYYATDRGGYLYVDQSGNCWRAYRFIEGTTPLPGAPQSAAQLGRALGLFHKSLNNFPVDTLFSSTEHFHNTPRRYEYFRFLLKNAPRERIHTARNEIEILLTQESTCSALLEMNAPARVTHGDVKLENLIIDPDSAQPICFIDYDNLMPGVIGFDFGDGARSCCKDCRTDERDMSRVQFRLESFDEYTREFVAQTRDLLDDAEAVSLAMGAVVMSLELGLRYLSEYLSGRNLYFKTTYPDQNLDRARVQLLMCLQMQKAYPQMVGVVKKHLMA